MTAESSANADRGRRLDAESLDPGGRMTAVLVVNYASSSLLASNVPEVAGPDVDGRPGEMVIVVDNFSGEEERRAVTSLAEARGWHVVADDGNPGFGTAVNAGVAEAWQRGCDVVVLLNPDLTLSADAVRRLAEAARGDGRAIVAPRVFTGDGRPWSGLGSIDLAGGRLWTDDRYGAQWLSGACLAFGRTAWDRIGGFDDDYGMYWEDVDLSFRVQAHGGRLRVLDDVEAVHAVGGTQNGGHDLKSPLYLYYNCRNRLVFAAKHLSRSQQWHWVLSTPADVRRVLSRDSATRRQKLASILGPVSAGVMDGVGWLVGVGRRRSSAPDRIAARVGRR